MSELIVKHNNFIEAKYYLTLTEIKIIAKLASMIQKDDDDFKSYKFTAKELLDDLKLNNNYDDLRDAIRKLLTKLVIIKTENSILEINFLSSAEYFNDSTIELCFDAKLKQYLLQLKENFTMYQFENVVALSSVYAIRIYELCKQYEKIKERTIEIKTLKEILEIEDKYKLYADLKKRVLKIAEREINEKTDITISFEEIKTSKKVTSIKFLIEKKEKEKSEIKETEDSIELIELFNLCKTKTDEIKKILYKSLIKFNYEYVKSNVLYTNKNAKTNYTVYLKNSLKNDYAKMDREKELKKAEIKKKQEQLEEIKKKREEEEKLKIEEQNKLREKALEFYENLNENIKEKIKEKAKELYMQEEQIKDFNHVLKKIYEKTLEKLYIHRIIRNTFEELDN